jgi:hypothetical protein
MRKFHFTLLALGVAVCLFIAMLVLLEVGRGLGEAQIAKYGEGARTGVGVVDGAIFGLLSLLLGFSFSGAASRFNDRRQLIIKEVNAISTAWQRISLLPSASQPPIRAGFRSYLDAVLSAYEQTTRSDTRERTAITHAQEEVWTHAMSACLDPNGEKARMLLLPSVNEMFDAVDRERLAREVHSPPMVFATLGIMALGAALYAGYALATGPRSWFYIIGAAASISLATFVILELEFPRRGLIRVDAMDQALVELRATMT